MLYESNLDREQAEDILARQSLGELINRTQELLGEKFKQGMKLTQAQEQEYRQTVKKIKENIFYKKYLAEEYQGSIG